MNDMVQYVNAFFDELEVLEDIEHHHCYKVFMHQAILTFLNNETKENAFSVYRAFFDSYRIAIAGESNPFLDLLDVLKNYEENAAILIDKQRDHYIHSVNVFILGLCIFAQSRRYQAAFKKTMLASGEYHQAYQTKNEEFYYRWGIAALFHDVGYPVEIVGRQINKFIGFATDADGADEKVNVQLTFENFVELNRIAEVTPKRAFTKCYSDQFEDCVYIDALKPVDLLAHRVHRALDVDLKSVKHSLDDFVNVMARCGFIDHGYYSAIIVLKWYGFLVQSAGFPPERFFWPVLDSASAILLHNCYKNVMQKAPFRLGPLTPDRHPVAYLLILCDELQEWNREAYGIKDKQRTLAAEARLKLEDDALDITFVTHGGSLPADFSREKKKLLYRLLDMSAVFDQVTVRCRALQKNKLPAPSGKLVPRPLLGELEQLAREIHNLYNQQQLAAHPDKPLKYPDFDALPDHLKYSNLRQAMDIFDKLELMGYKACPIADAPSPVTVIPVVA